MLALCSRDEVFRNVYWIAKVEDRAKAFEDFEDLRDGYLDFLSERQPSAPVNRSDDVFVENTDMQEHLSVAFSHGALNDLNQGDVLGDPYPKSIQEDKTQHARAAFSELLKLDDELAVIFDLVIHSVFVRSGKHSHGGSSSASIGTIWLAVVDGTEQLDLMEMYVHELTHHLLFIDELNHTQFNYQEIVRPGNFALSAILKRARPLDKVVHSIVVGAEMIIARHKFLSNHAETVNHPTTKMLQVDTLAAIDSVYGLPNIDDLITLHMRDIIDQCAEICRTPALDWSRC